MGFSRRISRIIAPAQPVPNEYRANFTHLYLDVFWYGVLNGSTLSFLTIFATRQGANGMQLGLINAVPAVVTLIFALPASTWLTQRPIRGGVFWSGLVFRLFYLFLIPLPALLMPNGQIWAIILITLVMSIPGTALSVGFNALFAEAVPVEWRGHVAGVRNAMLALTSTITTLGCGYLLTHIAFPTGYQWVFGIGALGALFSTIHVGMIKPVSNPSQTGVDYQLDEESSGRRNFLGRVGEYIRRQFRIDIIRGPFRKTVLLLFLFHLGQQLAIPIFPLYTVNSLHLSDQILSFGSGIFNLLTFLSSFQLEKWIRRMGNRKVLGIGVMMLSLYPALIALARGVGLYMVASVVGGVAWALAGGVLFNYLLEKVPEYDRPAYLAWYMLGFNAAILLGSMIGPAVAAEIGLVAAMAIFAVVRFVAGVTILRWG